MNLYKQYVRPHLEFAVPAWSPWTVGDKELLEKVQMRAIRMVSGLQTNTYEDRLKELNLPSLETRRLHYDLCQVFKIIRCKDDVRPSTWFDLTGPAPARITRHTQDPLNINKKQPKRDLRKNFFSHRVIDHWNRLPSEVKRAENVKMFKKQMEKLVHT